MARQKKRTRRSGAQPNANHQSATRKPLVAEANHAEMNDFLHYYRKKAFSFAQEKAKALTEAYPQHIFGWKALGTCLMESGQAEEALKPLKVALDLDGNDAETLAHLGKTCQRLGRHQDAEDYLTKALMSNPDAFQAHYRLARLYHEKGMYQRCHEHLDRALTIKPRDVKALIIRANTYSSERRFYKAQEVNQQLLRLAPHNAHVHNNLANLYSMMGSAREAERHYRKALDLMPSLATAFSNAYFTMHYNPDYGIEQLSRYSRQWDKLFAPESVPSRPTPWNSDAGRRIRIGLISGGFRNHPVGMMITPALESVPAREIGFHVYSTKLQVDDTTKRIKTAVDSWKDVLHLSQSGLAETIREDGIDILIDMSGHSEGNRLETLSLEPAPLIVKWVGGLFGTTGLKAIDYLISDSIETPQGVDRFYEEKLIRMPDDYICYLPPKYAPTPSPLPARDNGYITLGCFNNPAKVNETLLSEWAKLLHELPDSRLMLKGGQYESPEFCDKIHQALESKGIERERVILEGPSKHKAMMEAYHRVDIALDPWPYSGGLTTCEALLMGVPVVTLPGPSFAGRHSATHLVNAGLPELVVGSWEEYRERVVELAGDLESLSRIRQHLREILLRSPVCDGPRFAGHLTTALRAIWQRHCEGKPPAALTFEADGQVRFEGEERPVELPEVQVPASGGKEDGFQWRFEGKIIAIDNGGQLLHSEVVGQMVQRGALELIAFDPASRALKAPLNKQEGVHYYPNATLGDGEPSTLHACQDPDRSATLKPLRDGHLPEGVIDGNRVLTRLPVSTVALDRIEGLPSLDWLVLDAMNDGVTILEHGGERLSDALLLQVRVAFQPTHVRQPNLAEVSHWASRHGFRFYRLNEPKHRSLLPGQLPAEKRQATELDSADALFLPSYERMGGLTPSQRTKLAFLLHTAFGIRDMTYQLLVGEDEQSAEQYLLAEGMIREPVKKQWQDDYRSSHSAGEETIADELDRLLNNVL